MNLVQRATNILTQPRPEWDRIAAEPATTQSLFVNYALILALLPVLGTILLGLLSADAAGPAGALGLGFFIMTAIIGLVVGLGVMFLMGIIANALAPSFGGVKNSLAAMKLVVFSATAIWIAGLFNFIPYVGFLIGLAGFAYAAYLLYLGSMVLMRVPQGNAIGYTAVLIVIWIVIYFALAAILGGILFTIFFAGALATGGLNRY